MSSKPEGLFIVDSLTGLGSEQKLRSHKEIYKYEGRLTSSLVLSGDAGDPATPEDTLRRMAESPNDGIRAAVADNPSTPLEIIRQLAKDPQASVRYAVTQNPQTPPDLREELSRDPNPNVRQGTTWSPKPLTADRLKQLKMGQRPSQPC